MKKVLIFFSLIIAILSFCFFQEALSLNKSKIKLPDGVYHAYQSGYELKITVAKSDTLLIVKDLRRGIRRFNQPVYLLIKSGVIVDYKYLSINNL